MCPAAGQGASVSSSLAASRPWRAWGSPGSNVRRVPVSHSTVSPEASTATRSEITWRTARSRTWCTGSCSPAPRSRAISRHSGEEKSTRGFCAPGDGTRGASAPGSRAVRLSDDASSVGRCQRFIAFPPCCVSDGLSVAEEFVVLVVSAVAASEVGEVGDELDPFDPFDLLEAELDLVAEPQRCAMAERERLVVHVVGEHREVVAHVLDGVGVVVDAFVGSFAEGVEDDPLRLGLRLDDVDDRLHRDTSPFCDPGPALDAEVLCDLFVMGKGPQLRE